MMLSTLLLGNKNELVVWGGVQVQVLWMLSLCIQLMGTGEIMEKGKRWGAT